MILENPEGRYWRTDEKLGSRNIYALLSNDMTVVSEDDPFIGTMETSALTELVVRTHNKVLEEFGPRGLR